MYNRIPSERTSKGTLVVALLSCIALISLLTAGYFAWLIEQQRSSDVVLEKVSDAQDDVAVEDIEKVPDEVDVSTFVYPDIVQPERRTDAFEYWTLLTAMLSDWKEANRDSGFCTTPYRFARQESLRDYWQGGWQTPGYVYLADEGIRFALLSYFRVNTKDEQVFFDGIDVAMDSNDSFAQDGVMCSSDSGARKFLLLNDTREVVQESGDVVTQNFPEVLEWSEDSTLGPQWIVYPVGAYPIIDGYRFYPDWYGNVLVNTGYGDAGYANWEIQQLEVANGIPVITMLEKCTIVPTEDYTDSIFTCEVEYTE